MRSSRRKLGGIEHDEIETPARITLLPQQLKHIAFYPVSTRQAIAFRIAAGERQRLGRAVDSQHRAGTAGQRVQRKPSRVAETIQHVAAGSKLPHASAVL